MKGGGGFKVESLPKMINKEVLAQFMCKLILPNQPKNCLPWKNWQLGKI